MFATGLTFYTFVVGHSTWNCAVRIGHVEKYMGALLWEMNVLFIIYIFFMIMTYTQNICTL